MIRQSCTATSALILALALCGSVRGQASTLNLNVPGPADWNTTASWDFPFVPGDGFPEEIVGVSNGGEVTLTSAALFPVRGVVIGESGQFPPATPAQRGTMSISGAGSLNVVAGDNNSIGTFRIGANGSGTLNMTGGVLNVANALTLAGATDSALNLSGNASLSVGGASLQRNTRITGPNVTFESSADVSLSGTLIAEITGATHSLIDAFGSNAAVSGTLRADLSSFSPSVGTSWTLLQAASVAGNFQNLEVVGFTPADGAKFETVNTGTTARLDYLAALTLNVNRRTGVAEIVNHIGSIAFDGYAIGTDQSNLNPATWTSLDGQGTSSDSWLEANPTSDHLSELNPQSSSSLGAGQSFSLGSVHGAPTEFAAPDPVITFDYHQAGGRTVGGIVNVTGPINNLVLLVDPATGQTAIQNQSGFDISLDGYSIHSPSGSLRIAQWNSFEDQGVGDSFVEANPSTRRLNELNPTSALSLGGDGSPLSLGTPFNPAGTQDLAFTFHLAGGGALLGDTDGDGEVNLDDLNNVRNFFGTPSTEGDADHDGDTDLDDLNAVRNFFGESGGGSGPSGTFTGVVVYGAIPVGLSNVPEPSTWLLATTSVVIVSGLARRRRRGA